MVLDLVVLGILLLSALVAFWRGFVREVLTIFSLGGASILTLMWGPKVTPYFSEWLIDPNAEEPQKLFDLVPYDMVAPAAAFATVFIVTLILLSLAAHLISRGVHIAGLGPIDRSLGVVFGLLRGAIIIGLLSLVVNFVLSEERRETLFEDSQTYPYVAYMAELMEALLPNEDPMSIDLKDKATQLMNKKTGTAPLEPGQVGGGQSDTGYTRAQRDKVDRLIEKNPSKGDYNFNE